MKNIPLANPIISRRDIKAVTSVLKSGQLAQGKEVASFENEFSIFVGGRECVAVNSGTSALQVALLALSVGEGDEVLVPSFTFAATANAVRLVGATPIFVDIDPMTFCVSVEDLRSKITPRSKAVIVVHLYGLPANMLEIMKVTDSHNLLLIEDAAQAHLASIDGIPVGTFGDAGIFSFYPTKNMTSGEGGMITLKQSEIARTCRLLRNQGMEIRYQNEIVGFNLRMTDIHAALGRSQLKNLTKWTEKRIQNADYYFRHIEDVGLPYVPKGFRHVYHQFTLRLENSRDNFAKNLKAKGISCDVYYPTPVHRLSPYLSELELPFTDRASQEVLSIPINPKLTKRELATISSEVNFIARKLL